MKGLELSRSFYLACGKEMIETQFSEYADRIAVGLVGEGSECLGFDDEISTDHDFEPGFCLFITREDERKFGFPLERAYAKLPKEFNGFKRQPLSPVGGNRHGVIVIDDFYTKFLGAPSAPETAAEWLMIPSSALLCASDGEIFRDDLGAFSEVRNILKKGYPEDIRRKKLAANLIFMAQSGQYNFERCVKRGESGAAQLAVFDFVRHAISAAYLLGGAYEPFYKWAYRGMRDLPVLSELETPLTRLTVTGNTEAEATEKAALIEEVSQKVISELRSQNLSGCCEIALEGHAYSVQNGIRDVSLRNMHIMEGA